MVNYPINEAETIFEAFYDGGDSYPDHEKYCRLDNYTVTYAEGAVATVSQRWAYVGVDIQRQPEKGYAVKLERDCQLDISGYDIFRLFAGMGPNVDLRIQCVIDGQKITVLEQSGKGDTDEYNGSISGHLLTHYSLEFGINDGKGGGVELKWLGLANKTLQDRMEAKQSPFHEEWEGCFVESPQVGPMIGIYFSEEELPALRERLNKEPFLGMLNQLRERAKAAMLIPPEPYITEYIPYLDRRWIRRRDVDRPVFWRDMDVLALVGLLDNDMDMLRMACRKMLAAAVTPNWTESVMGCLPGATWHHRSFTEELLCSACALVLDWAGSLLTWHGKNIVYDALMLKGLPRLEADFHSVEYIRKMNQGIIFNRGRILTLLALSHRYPRYESRLKEAAVDEREMIDHYIMEDGGICEGVTYWNYTFTSVLTIVALLARHDGKTLEEYAWDKLKKTGEYALAMLSDVKDGTYHLAINDAHVERYSPVTCALYFRISNDPRWSMLYSRMLQDKNNRVSIDMLLFSEEAGEAGEISKDGFATFNYVGHTSLRRTTNDVGRIHCAMSGGASIFAHCHGDKGQILLEVDGSAMLIDRGMCAYSNPEGMHMPKASRHNVFFPEASEGQMDYDQDMYGPGAKVIRSSYENGVFDYCTDTTSAWKEGIFHSVTRSVRSEDPHLYLIYDDAEFVQESESSFRLNTYGSITQEDNAWIIRDGNYQITVLPVNYKPAYAWMGEYGVDAELQPVQMLRLYLSTAKEQHIITLLEVSRVGQNRAKVLSEQEIEYNGKRISLWEDREQENI